MPIHILKCTGCEKEIEYFVQTRTHPRVLCVCGQPMERQPTAAAVHFKGSGWTPKGNKTDSSSSES